MKGIRYKHIHREEETIRKRKYEASMAQSV